MNETEKLKRPWGETLEEKLRYFETIRPLNDVDLRVVCRIVAKRITRDYYRVGFELGYDIDALFAYIEFYVRCSFKTIPPGKTVRWQYSALRWRVYRYLKTMTDTQFEGFWRTRSSCGGLFHSLSDLAPTEAAYDSYKVFLEQCAYIRADSAELDEKLDYMSALEKGMSELNETDRRVVELLIENDFDLAALQKEYAIANRTAYRWKSRALDALASVLRAEFGELVDGEFNKNAVAAERRYLTKSGKEKCKKLCEYAARGPFSRAMFMKDCGVHDNGHFPSFAILEECGFLIKVNAPIKKQLPWEKFYVWNQKKTQQDLIAWYGQKQS